EISGECGQRISQTETRRPKRTHKTRRKAAFLARVASRSRRPHWLAKSMHWRRYDRLRRLHDQAVERSLGMLAPFAKRTPARLNGGAQNNSHSRKQSLISAYQDPAANAPRRLRRAAREFLRVVRAQPPPSMRS